MFGPIFNLIYDEARRIWCYRWLMTAISAGIFVVAAVIIFALPNVYKSSGQLLVSEHTSLTKAAEGVSLGDGDYADTNLTQQAMLNREVLRKVYTHAYPNAPRAEADAAIGDIGGRVKITPEGDSGFIEISYTAADPVMAQKITAAFMDQFIEESLHRNVRELNKASAFLDKQIASYATQLADVQSQMAEFRRQHPRVAMAPVAVAAPTGDGRAEIAGARAELAAAMGRTSRAAPIVAPQDAAIADAEGRLAGMLTQYTEQHPDVIAVRRQIAALKAQRAQYVASAPAPTAQVDPSVAAARARLAVAQARARSGEGSATATPDLAARWAELTRRSETLQANRQQMVDRREATKMSQVVYGSADTGMFQITRPASIPGAPTGPDRPLFLAAAAVIALGAGVTAAYLRAGISGIFVSPRELENALQLPVIGTVSWEPAWHVSKSKRSTPALPAR